jgi:hypothetical protein
MLVSFGLIKTTRDLVKRADFLQDAYARHLNETLTDGVQQAALLRNIEQHARETIDRFVERHEHHILGRYPNNQCLLAHCQMVEAFPEIRAHLADQRLARLVCDFAFPADYAHIPHVVDDNLADSYVHKWTVDDGFLGERIHMWQFNDPTGTGRDLALRVGQKPLTLSGVQSATITVSHLTADKWRVSLSGKSGRSLNHTMDWNFRPKITHETICLPISLQYSGAPCIVMYGGPMP